MQDISLVVEIAWRMIQSPGIIVGGVWVYIPFIRCKKLASRLSLNVHGIILTTTAGLSETHSRILTAART